MITHSTSLSMLILILVGAGLGLGYNYLHPEPLPWKTVPKQAIELNALDPGNGDGDPSEPSSAAGSEESPGNPETAVTENLYPDIPDAQFPIQVGLAKAKTFFDRGGLVVLDAREEYEFEEGHISGAIAAPYDAMVADVDWLEAMAKDPRPILVYCGGGDCELSLNLGFELCQNGHSRVLVLKDGFSEWAEAGFPTAEGATP